MALTVEFNVGDKVSIKRNSIEYFGLVISKHTFTASNIEYQISIFALGEVVVVNSLTAEATDVVKIV